jgi:hypothetical protein
VIKLDSCWINQWMDGYIGHSRLIRPSGGAINLSH